MKKILLTSFAFTGITLLVWLFGATSCFRNTYNVLYERIDSRLYRYEEDTYHNLIREDTGLAAYATVPREHLLLSGHLFMHLFLTQAHTGWNNLGTRAWAYKPGPAVYHHQERIKEVRIITLHDYNQSYPAGSDMAPICSFYAPDNSGQWVDRAGLYEKINTIQEQRMELLNFIDARLMESPQNAANEQQFVIQVYTDKGEMLSDTTLPVFIQ